MPTGRHPSGCRPIEFGLFRTLDFRLFLQGRDAGPTGFRRLTLELENRSFHFLGVRSPPTPKSETLKPTTSNDLLVL